MLLTCINRRNSNEMRGKWNGSMLSREKIESRVTGCFRNRTLARNLKKNKEHLPRSNKYSTLDKIKAICHLNDFLLGIFYLAWVMMIHGPPWLELFLKSSTNIQKAISLIVLQYELKDKIQNRDIVYCLEKSLLV